MQRRRRSTDCPKILMNLREAWAASAMAGLGWEADVEKAIDRVAAGGRCGSLGLRLWHARYQNEVMAYRGAVLELQDVLRRRFPRESPFVRSVLVRQALMEYMIE